VAPLCTKTIRYSHPCTQCALHWTDSLPCCFVCLGLQLDSVADTWSPKGGGGHRRRSLVEVIKSTFGRKGSVVKGSKSGSGKRGSADGGDGDTLTTLSPEMAHHMQKMRAGVSELQTAGLYVPRETGSDEEEDPYGCQCLHHVAPESR